MSIRVSILLLLISFVLACSGGPKKTTTKVFTQGAIEATDPQAQARFDDAVLLLEAGEFRPASEELQLIQAEYPLDPISQVAELYLARATLSDWSSDITMSTRSVLAGLAADVQVDGRIRYAALLYHAAGLVRSDRQAAFAMISDYPGEQLSPAILKRDRTMAWALLAENRPTRASGIATFGNGFVDVEGLPDAGVFRDHARARAFALAESASEDELGQLLTESKSQFTRAIAGFVLLQSNSSNVNRERVIAELIAIGAPDRAARLRSKSAPKEGSAVIALVIPLTGPQAAIGKRATNAGLLAIDALNTNSKGAVTLAFIDSNQDVSNITQELQTQEISVFVGPLDNGQAKELTTWAREENVLMIAPVAELPEAFEESWGFRNFISPSAESEAIAKVVGASGDTNLLILHPKIAYGERMKTEVMQSLAALAPNVTIQEMAYDRSANDFSKVAAKVAKLKPQAIFIPDTAQKVAQVTAFLAQQNLWGIPITQKRSRRSKRTEVHYLGTSLWQHGDLARQAGSYIAGATIPVWQSSHFGDPASARFHEAYQAAFGTAAGDIEAFIYDSVRMIRQPMELHGLYGAVELRETLLGQQGYVGVTGNVRFLATGEPVRTVRFLTIRDGQFSELEFK